MTPTPPDDGHHLPHRRRWHATGAHHQRRWLATGAHHQRGLPGRAHANPTRPLPRPTRRTTVWPCVDAEPLPGTAPLTGWLARVIITLVTGYTTPGQRVLLYAPPPPPQRRPDFRGDAGGGPDPFAGIHEAAWTVARLGRGCDTAAAHRIPINTTAGRTSPPDPRIPPGHLHQHHQDRGRRLPADRTHARAADLIITAVRPRFAGWVSTIDWPGMLTPHGTLAAITHSDHIGGQFVDRIPTLVTTFRHQGLGWLDHVIVLTAPPETAGASPGTRGHRRIHYDLLLFATDTGTPRQWRQLAGRDHA